MDEDVVITAGSIGLLGRIHVDACPYCGEEHFHDGVNPGDTVLSGCGVGEYVLDCERKTGNLAAIAAAASRAAKEAR